MAEQATFAASWEAYQLAVEEMYAAPFSMDEMFEEGAKGAEFDPIGEAGDVVAERSAEIRTLLSDTINNSDDGSQRELAALKLLTAAAYDLGVATDMAGFEELDFSAEIDASGTMEVTNDMTSMEILNAPLEGGMEGLIKVETKPLSPEAEAAKTILQEQIEFSLTQIPADALALSADAVAGITTLGLGPAKGMLGMFRDQLAVNLPDNLSAVGRRVAKMVIEAVLKIRAAIDDDSQAAIQSEAEKWYQELQEKGDAVNDLMGKLYQVEKIEEEVKGKMVALSAELTPEAIDTATKAIADLQARFAKSKDTLALVMRGLAFAKGPLLAAPPWGPAAIYAAYIGIFSYAIFNGGDYLDWYRLGEREWLDRVDGVRTIVNGLEPVQAIDAETQRQGEKPESS